MRRPDVKKRGRQKPHRSHSFTTLIVSLFSVFMAAIVIVMSVFSYSYLYRTLEERTIADNEVIVRQAAESIGRHIDNIRSVSTIIDTNRGIRSYLADPHSENAGLERARFRSFLNYLPQIDDSVEAVFIFNADREVVYAPSYLHLKPGYDIRNELWYQTISETRTSAPHLIPTSVRTMTKDENPWVISIARNILDERTGEILGYQLVELSYSAIDNILGTLTLGTNGYLFVVDGSGTMIYHPQLQLINFGLKEENVYAAIQTSDTAILEDEGKIYSVAAVPETDYRVVGVTYLESIVAPWQQMLLVYVLFALIMSFGAFVGAVHLARYISRPLGRLEGAAGQIAKGELDTSFDGHGTLETEHVAQALGTMLDRVRELMDQSVRDQDQIRVSEIRTLQAQINPHFLYNTLDTIVWMAEETGAQEIRELTMALATYFRVVLSSGRDMITVREEMTHVSSYLYIQKVRYEMLDYEVQVSDEAAELYMPKILVQPIVENAIYHGIRDNGARGRIDVSAEVSDGRLRIQVRDTGRGMRKRELENIWKRSGARAGRGGGVALANIQERIHLFFGDEYGVRIESELRRGTLVTMELPVIRNSEDAAR